MKDLWNTRKQLHIARFDFHDPGSRFSFCLLSHLHLFRTPGSQKFSFYSVMKPFLIVAGDSCEFASKKVVLFEFVCLVCVDFVLLTACWENFILSGVLLYACPLKLLLKSSLFFFLNTLFFFLRSSPHSGRLPIAEESPFANSYHTLNPKFMTISDSIGILPTAYILWTLRCPYSVRKDRERTAQL